MIIEICSPLCRFHRIVICAWIWPSIRAGQLQVGHWSEVNLELRTLFYQCLFTNRKTADIELSGFGPGVFQYRSW